MDRTSALALWGGIGLVTVLIFVGTLTLAGKGA